MKLLLDTHVLLWALADDPRLGTTIRTEIERPSDTLFVSAATIWEVEIKVALGKLSLGEELVGVLVGSSIETLPISWFHAQTAGRLPRHHGDPFDRMLIAQAQCDGLTLVSNDHAFAQYDVSIFDPSD